MFSKANDVRVERGENLYWFNEQPYAIYIAVRQLQVENSYNFNFQN